MIELDPRISALVLIDLQKGILGYSLAPVTSQELLERGQARAERFRAGKATVGHEMSMKHIMPRLGRIVQSSDITLTRT
jgi:hypothetical protein